MSGGIAVTHYDNEPLASGTQKNAAGGTTILNGRQDFYSCGVRIGLAIRNTTTGTSGHVVSVDEDKVVADISFALLDAYEIYCTDTYNASIDRHLEDKRFGHKTTNRANLQDGLFPEDIDDDEHQRRIHRRSIYIE